jgi:hypothetical protein
MNFNSDFQIQSYVEELTPDHLLDNEKRNVLHMCQKNSKVQDYSSLPPIKFPSIPVITKWNKERHQLMQWYNIFFHNFRMPTAEEIHNNEK